MEGAALAIIDPFSFLLCLGLAGVVKAATLPNDGEQGQEPEPEPEQPTEEEKK